MRHRRRVSFCSVVFAAMWVVGCASPTTDANRSGVDPLLIEPSRDEAEAQAWRESGNEVMADYFEQKIRDEQEARRSNGPVGALIDIFLE